MLTRPAGPESQAPRNWSGASFTDTMNARRQEADAFYATLTPTGTSEAEASVMRQAFAGMIWGKQFYPYQVSRWLDGDPGQPVPPPQRLTGRNSSWRTLHAFDVISMPDAWEYPWFAAWDLAFHSVTLAYVDPPFAKHQLLLMLREWYSSPQGAIPAYEWNFSDVNPPVHAWAALRVFELDGGTDHAFLARVFDKLLINFTWWLNREDPDGNNVFQGGFLGLDNIGPINRSQLPPGYRLAQADGTGWMAFYSLIMLRIAAILARRDPVHTDFVVRFFEHFALIADGIDQAGMWDADEGFFYDRLRYPDGHTEPIRARSLVGLLPVLATAVIDRHYLRDGQSHERQLAGFVRSRGLGEQRLRRVGVIESPQEDGPVLIALVDPARLVTILGEVLDEDGMLAPTGIRSLSKRHQHHPVSVTTNGTVNTVDYEPAESTTSMYGGNSNWRGPVWFPLNVLLADALDRFGDFVGDQHTVEMPAGSGTQATLHEVAAEIRRRLVSTFLPGPEGRRPVFGGTERFQTDPRWNDAVRRSREWVPAS